MNDNLMDVTSSSEMGDAALNNEQRLQLDLAAEKVDANSSSTNVDTGATSPDDLLSQDNAGGEGQSEADKNSLQQQQQAAALTDKSEAVFVTSFGGLIRNVKVLPAPEIAPKSNEVSVTVKCCGMSFLDLMTRQGLMDNLPKPPFVMGCECAGEVETVGENVQNLQVGDRVVVICETGAWQSKVVVNEDFVFRIPEAMTFEEAAVFPFTFLPAYFMIQQLHLQAEDVILLHSAGGGVGLALAQLAVKLCDAKVVGTASKVKHEAVQKYYTLLIDHNTDYQVEMKKLYPDGIDAVLDSRSGEDVNKGFSLLKPMGKYILYGASNLITGERKSFFNVAKSWWQMERISPMKLLEENKSVGGFSLHALLFRQKRTDLLQKAMLALFSMYENKEIKVHVDSVWPMANAVNAMKKLHYRKNIGSLVLDPALSLKTEEDLTESMNLSVENNDI